MHQRSPRWWLKYWHSAKKRSFPQKAAVASETGVTIMVITIRMIVAKSMIVIVLVMVREHC